MAHETVGNTLAEWEDHEPLIFTLTEETGSKDDRRLKTEQFNLSSLRAGYEDGFLLNLKELLLARSHRVVLRTVNTEYMNIRLLFSKVTDHDLFDTRISVIDESFLLALNTITEKISSASLENLKLLFNYNTNSPIFAQGLRRDDFPIKSDKKGQHGRQLSNILTTALTRSTCVEILIRCEEAYEDGSIDIGLFSFINLAFAVYCRPDSYRRIKLKDLVYDSKIDAFFLYIPPAKSRVQKPQKICYPIDKNVGMLLSKQRQQVIEKYGHLVNPDDIGKLSLFPARKLKSDKSEWISKHANGSLGEIESGSDFHDTYFRQIKDVVLNGKKGFGLGACVLRHTIGTQLATLGCSANTIQAVLKHAGDASCMAYVDIAFHGLINELSDSLQPAFEACLPVFQRFRSKDDVVVPNKAIYSEVLETGRTELTGECGKQIRCEAAPFTCYSCNKFIPCFDADHSMNMDIIQSDIELYGRAGTPYRHLVEKAKAIKKLIQLVMTACNLIKNLEQSNKEAHE